MADARQHVYEVTEVFGYEAGAAPVKVGDILIDRYKGQGIQQWDVLNLATGKQRGGWLAHYLGKRQDVLPVNATPDSSAQVTTTGSSPEGVE